MTIPPRSDESEASLRGLISALSGGAIDWRTLDSEIMAVQDVLRIMAQLWDFEGINSEYPASVFYAGWDEAGD